MMTPATIEELVRYAALWNPMEMCGLLFSGDRFHGCLNNHADPEHGFEIAYAEYLHGMALYGEAPWATVHSHPNGPAKISGRDMLLLDAQAAVGNTMKMIIVGCQPMEIRIYAKVDDPFRPYRCEWQWAPPPMEAKPICFAQTS